MKSPTQLATIIGVLVAAAASTNTTTTIGVYGSATPDHHVRCVPINDTNAAADHNIATNNDESEKPTEKYVNTIRQNRRPPRHGGAAVRATSFSAAPRPTSQSASKKNIPIEFQYLLEQTNIIREFHNVKPLRYDTKLASLVQKGADKCPGFEHFKAGNTWQNLASGSPCKSEDKCVVHQESEAYRFYKDEEPLWNYDKRKCEGGDWLKCGHFVIQTAPEQRTMGCGWSSCKNGANVWCNYKGLKGKNPVIPKPKGTSSELKSLLQKHHADFIKAHK